MTNDPAAVSSNFILDAVAEDLRTGRFTPCARASHPNRTAICTSAMPRQSASISAPPRHSAASATCALTTPTRSKKMSNTSTRSRKTSIGWVSIGKTANITPRIISTSSTSLPQRLIQKGRPTSMTLSAEQIREYRGTLTEAGQGKPLPQPLCRRKPGPVRADARR